MSKAVSAALAAACLMAAQPAAADVLIDNVNGISIGTDGEVDSFAAVLIGDDGKVSAVYEGKEKRPAKVRYRLDGRGRTMIPGPIASHLRIMDLGFALLRARAGLRGAPAGEPRPEDRDIAFAAAQDALLAAGITTAVDMGTTIEDWQAYRRAGDAGALRLRVVAYAPNVRDMALIGGPRPSPWLYGDRLKFNGLALGGGSGAPAIAAVPLRNLMSRAAIDGFQVAVEANDAATQASVIEALDELVQTYHGDRRWRMDTRAPPDPAMAQRLKQLGGLAVVSEAQDGQGVPRPFAALAGAASRTAGLRALTADAAGAIFAEGRLGRLARGTQADFLLIDRDPLVADADTLRQARVSEMWIGGVKIGEVRIGEGAPRAAGPAGPAAGPVSGTGQSAIDSFRDR